ncbi:MAG: hypothetical protein JWP01_1930 [Myxococcales bacterium]|nr:hypothetical protein [Myxococcales bacterium]
MKGLVACLLVACSSAGSPPPRVPAPPTPWPVPDGWKHELIAFPLGFAPSLAHDGVEEIRFAPGFFQPAAPGYWSYAFVWRLDNVPAFDASTVAAELTTYFRGLVDAVDETDEIADRESIVVRAKPEQAHLALAAHVIDAFASKLPVELVGTASQIVCPRGALWVFSFAPERSALTAEVAALAARAACDQPTVPNAPRP